MSATDQVVDNISAAVTDHQKNIDVLVAKTRKFAGSDPGSWLVVGSLAVPAAAIRVGLHGDRRGSDSRGSKASGYSSVNPDLADKSRHSRSDFPYGGGLGVTRLQHLNLRAEYERINVHSASGSDAFWLRPSWRFQAADQSRRSTQTIDSHSAISRLSS